VFQPLAQGVPALFGPHMNNQRDIAAGEGGGVGFEVRDAEGAGGGGDPAAFAFRRRRRRRSRDGAGADRAETRGWRRCVDAVARCSRDGGA
jgi:hypothetical protein